METKDGDCPLRWNYSQEQFIIQCYRAEAGQPAYGFWDMPNWVKQGMNILAQIDAARPQQT